MSNKTRVTKYRQSPKGKENHRKLQRKASLKRKFGLTLEAYESMLQRQDGKCAICGHLPHGEDTYRLAKNLAVDHDHITGRVRGLLCDKCNRGLGHFNDNVLLLQKAISYLQTASLEGIQPKQ